MSTHRRRAAASVTRPEEVPLGCWTLDSRLSQSEKDFPGTARLIQPELQQNKIQIPVANYNFTLTRSRDSRLSQADKVFPGTAMLFEPELLTSFLV